MYKIGGQDFQASAFGCHCQPVGVSDRIPFMQALIKPISLAMVKDLYDISGAVFLLQFLLVCLLIFDGSIFNDVVLFVQYVSGVWAG